MALDPNAEAALALHRFGLGPRTGSVAAIASDPRGALVAELDRPNAGRITTAELADERRRRARRVPVPGGAPQRAPRRRPNGARRVPRRRAPLPRLRRAPPAEHEPRRAGAAAGHAAGAGRTPASRRNSSISTRPRPASPPRSSPTSASPSGWPGSGRTISASRPTRAACGRWPARSSARRSARMCSAASSTCCTRSRAIRRC